MIKTYAPSRRHALLGLLAAPALLRTGAADSQVRAIRVVDGGGTSGESFDAGFAVPFTARTGVQVIKESPNPLGRLRAMVEARNVTVAGYALGGAGHATAKGLNLLEPLDWGLIDPRPMFPETRDSHGIGFQFFSNIMCWRQGLPALSSWTDFWNVQRFPGRRSLQDSPQTSLLAALLADGVAPANLFPLDLNRAFASLDRIKRNVSVWWRAGAQPPQLLRDNEVQYAMAFSGRVVLEAGISFTYRQGLLEIAFLGVPRGVNRDEYRAIMGLMHEITIPQNQLRAAQIIPYPGPSPDLEPILPRELLPLLPTTGGNKDLQIQPDATYFNANANEIQQRWERFKLTL
jgi:putative spermidine/putrescine transport system substrate-binding protein